MKIKEINIKITDGCFVKNAKHEKEVNKVNIQILLKLFFSSKYKKFRINEIAPKKRDKVSTLFINR